MRIHQALLTFTVTKIPAVMKNSDCPCISAFKFKSHRKTIGSFPEMTVSDARREAIVLHHFLVHCPTLYLT